jgi:hypothetical protein
MGSIYYLPPGGRKVVFLPVYPLFYLRLAHRWPSFRAVKQSPASKAAQILGSMKSEKKAAAARKNGLLGGWHKNFKKKDRK